jgi:hypothetical protein
MALDTQLELAISVIDPPEALHQLLTETDRVLQGLIRGLEQKRD